MKLRPASFGLLTVLLLGFAIACDGDSGNASTGSAAAQPLDLSESADKLLALRSFRFSFNMKLELPSNLGKGSEDDAFGAALAGAFLGLLGDIKAEGAFVAPDSVEAKMTFAGQEVSYVQIGNRAWVKEGSAWQATAATASSGLGFDPTDLFFDILPQDALRGAKTSSETVNGVDTTRYSFDKAALEKLIAESGEDIADFQGVSKAKLDVWITGDSIPVKIVMDITGDDKSGQDVAMHLEMNIRDLNSSSITIKPPI